MAKKAAKRARLSGETFDLPHKIHTSYYREYPFGICGQVGTASFSIPWPMLIASVRRYNAVQRQKRQRKG